MVMSRMRFLFRPFKSTNSVRQMSCLHVPLGDFRDQRSESLMLGRTYKIDWQYSEPHTLQLPGEWFGGRDALEALRQPVKASPELRDEILLSARIGALEGCLYGPIPCLAHDLSKALALLANSLFPCVQWV